MNKNLHLIIAQSSNPQPQYHEIAFNSFRQVLLPEIIVLLITGLSTCLSSWILMQIKKLKSDIEADLRNRKKIRKLSVPEFNQVKEIFYEIIISTKFNRISLFLIQDYNIINNDLIATSFSVGAQVTNGLLEIGVFDEKIDYIVQAVNDLLESKTKYKYFRHRDDGYICAAWLRQRNAISYGIFLLEDAKGIILLENKQKLFNFKWINNIDNINLLNNLTTIDNILS